MLEWTGEGLAWARKGETSTKWFSFKYVRLLAFLRNPTDTNWAYLANAKLQVFGADSKSHPFCHTCHNGELKGRRKPSAPAGTNKNYGCINGMEHGFFGTPAVNNGMKPCATSARGRWDCPGHGPQNARHCMFVDKDTGSYLPCRNSILQGDHKSCPCTPNCFRRTVASIADHGED